MKLFRCLAEGDETKEFGFSGTGDKGGEGIKGTKDCPAPSRHLSWVSPCPVWPQAFYRRTKWSVLPKGHKTTSVIIPATDSAPRGVLGGWVTCRHCRPGLDWCEPPGSATGFRRKDSLGAGGSASYTSHPFRTPDPGCRPGWVWQSFCLRWFRPPTGSTARQSRAGAAGWAGLEGEGRAGTATAGAGSAEGAAGAGAERRGGAGQSRRLSGVPE